MTSTHEPAQPAWRLLDEPGGFPPLNLAREEAIARAARLPTLRLWQNSRCVVLGRYQVREAEVSLAHCAAARVPIYRRFTGGGAVYHDAGNLNISLILPRNSFPLSCQPALARVPQVYSLVLTPLASALRSMGLQPQASPREVLVANRKISGAASWLGHDSVLVHATLLLDADLETLGRVLDGPGDPGNVRWEKTRSRRSPVTSLAREGVLNAASSRVRLAVISAFAAHWSVGVETGKMSAPEILLANRLLAVKYSRSAWHASGAASPSRPDPESAGLRPYPLPRQQVAAPHGHGGNGHAPPGGPVLRSPLLSDFHKDTGPAFRPTEEL